MKTILLLFSLSLSVAAFSQGLFTTLTGKFGDKEGFSATNLSKDMFDLYLKKKQIEPNSPVYETLKKLDNILVVSYTNLPHESTTPDKTTESVSDVQKTVLDFYNGQKFTLFKTENRNGEDLKVFLKKNGEKVNSLALVSSHSTTRFTLVELTGDVDLSGISDLNKAMNLKGLENLYKINGQQDNFGLWQRYPEGLSFSAEQQEEMQKNLQQAYEDMNKLKTEKMTEWKLQNKEMLEKQKEMAERYREMGEKYGRSPIFLSAPGDTNMVYYIDGKKVNAQEIRKLNPDQIESIEIVKPADKAKPSKKGEMKIKTKK
jgi:hypothetical protein